MNYRDKEDHEKMIKEIIRTNRVTGIIHHMVGNHFTDHYCKYIELYHEILAIDKEIKEMAKADFQYIEKCEHKCDNKTQGLCCICWELWKHDRCKLCIRRSKE